MGWDSGSANSLVDGPRDGTTGAFSFTLDAPRPVLRWAKSPVRREPTGVRQFAAALSGANHHNKVQRALTQLPASSGPHACVVTSPHTGLPQHSLPPILNSRGAVGYVASPRRHHGEEYCGSRSPETDVAPIVSPARWFGCCMFASQHRLSPSRLEGCS
ncbi:hypothetical protein VUR80DRAFT_6771 [Thermomyces stellatus]